ncbi:aminotransferase class I/II-fold pyridoxal phosphate-dependent enzyme [Dysgonomonas macrotermitis]|uniref:Aminotransferase n=1 Tax=Dysgonomonas macrotermitis TaxID=1346286 RepID=A0A1M4WZH5_9BACT|nr:aminotransferase class I/II-fold pyridoxal phosphate-dependent enzyme [Dysgonomonas macrotermitis]SHE86605.1 L-threonine O-3-phosphate decarboxylase [Dysgonomonas macrotermitis]
MLNGHGDDIYAHDNKIVSNFSSNVYNNLDLTKLEEYLCTHISSIHSYPEPDAITLRKIISRKLNISSGSICVTNGATEAIYLIAQAFREAKTAVVIPTFSEYEDACRIQQHRLYFIESLDEIEPDTKLVWICNPNNPTGKIYDPDYLRDTISSHPDIYFVIDQSYAGFTEQKVWSPDEALQFNNVLLLHSLTKCYAIPGLRLGYITAPSELIERISYYSMPWSVNQMAQLAGQYLLENEEYDLSESIEESRRVQNILSVTHGIEILPSEMHYFLCKLEKGKASDLKQYLISKYGILIRDASNFRGLTAGHFRIAIQSPEENEQLINAIGEWIKLHC